MGFVVTNGKITKALLNNMEPILCETVNQYHRQVNTRIDIMIAMLAELLTLHVRSYLYRTANKMLYTLKGVWYWHGYIAKLSCNNTWRIARYPSCLIFPRHKATTVQWLLTLWNVIIKCYLPLWTAQKIYSFNGFHFPICWWIYLNAIRHLFLICISFTEIGTYSMRQNAV